MLAAALTGWELNVISSTEAINKNESESANLKNIFMDKLQVDEDLAQVLISEGFASIEEIAYVPVQELLEIDGFDDEIVTALRTCAKNVLLTEAIAKQAQDDTDATDDNESLESLEGIDAELLLKLKQADILTRDGLAELSVDDLLEISNITKQEAATLIMAARAHWFKEA